MSRHPFYDRATSPRRTTSGGTGEEASTGESRAEFEHSTPVLYDRYMGPLLFAPRAELVVTAGR
jgi:hypothetical protein